MQPNWTFKLFYYITYVDLSRSFSSTRSKYPSILSKVFEYHANITRNTCSEPLKRPRPINTNLPHTPPHHPRLRKTNMFSRSKRDWPKPSSRAPLIYTGIQQFWNFTTITLSTVLKVKQSLSNIGPFKRSKQTFWNLFPFIFIINIYI